MGVRIADARGGSGLGGARGRSRRAVPGDRLQDDRHRVELTGRGERQESPAADHAEEEVAGKSGDEHEQTRTNTDTDEQGRESSRPWPSVSVRVWPGSGYP